MKSQLLSQEATIEKYMDKFTMIPKLDILSATDPVAALAMLIVIYKLTFVVDATAPKEWRFL